MASDIQTLESLCSLIVDCPHSTPVWTESGFVVLRNQNIKHGRLDLSSPSFTDAPQFAARTRRAKPMLGDIVITREAPMGDVCMVPDGLECCLGQRQVLLRPNPSLVTPRFLHYALQSSLVQNQIAWSKGTGSTVSNLRIPVLKALNIPVLPRDVQDGVAAVLGALDDRVDLLQQTHTTLEAITQALFKSWFVDFDPERAKAEGLAPVGIDGDTASLFPGEFKESDLGPIPRSWRILTLSEVLTEQSERVGGRDVPEYSSTNDGLRLRSERFNKSLSVSIAKNKMVRSGWLVFGLSRKVLNFGLMRDPIGCVSSAYKVFSVDENRIPASFLERFIRLKSNYFFRAVSASSREGQSLSAHGLGMLKFVQPPQEVAAKFLEIAGALSSRSDAIQIQVEALMSIRDLLLSHLIPGTPRLPQAETLIEAAVA